MASQNVVPADEVYARNMMVSLFIPKPFRLAGELLRVPCRVVQHTRAGYQLNSAWGLLSGRYPHNQLNRVIGDTGIDIPSLTVQATSTVGKIGLAKVVAKMNGRGPISAAQRAGRKKVLRERTRQQSVVPENIDVDDGETASCIEVESAEPVSSPSVAAATRNTSRYSQGRKQLVKTGRMKGGRGGAAPRLH